MSEIEGISLALLLSESEAETARSASMLTLTRATATAIRGPVALADGAGRVFARAVVEAIETTVSEPAGGRCRWRLGRLEQLPGDFELRGRLLGPLWARLSETDRRALAGDAEPARAAQEDLLDEGNYP